MSTQDRFSSRWGLILAGLGMAVGTGNLWRFPRIAAQNGGAAFLIPWLLFLVVWSLPLLIAEFGLGRGSRRGVIGAFAELIGRRYAWMGGFIALTSVMILFYYSVVTGWTLKYFVASLSGALTGSGAEAYWNDYTNSIWEPLLFHIVSVLIGASIVIRGVVGGIERANKILIPLLLGLLIVAVIRSVTLPGASSGLKFLFNPDLTALNSYQTWLEALTQSAWSTGAGWGLILTYAAYTRSDEDIVGNAVAIGVGNNIASLLAGMAIVPTAFALLSENRALDAMAAGNTGLTFIWIPQLFERMPGGAIFLALFFLALFCAAMSSLVAMVELATRIFIDSGLSRRRAVHIVAIATILGGAPSAINLTVFENQDWVWGLALMVSGLFIAIGVRLIGVKRFRTGLVDVPRAGRSLSPIFDWVLIYVVPVEFTLMFGWWVYQSVIVLDPSEWWNPVRTYSLGTCLFQWGIALVLLLLFNQRIASASLRRQVE